MIHYFGCSDCGRQLDAAKALRGRHALVSFAYPHYLPIVAEVCQSFALDNGAFTAWRKGKKLDLPGYLAWVEKWRLHPAFDWAVIPDVIDGDERANNALLREWPSDWKHCGVPVWHLHESLERLKMLMSGYRRLALGSSGTWKTPGTPAWWERMGQAMGVLCDEQGRPKVRLHGLRMLAPSIFCHLPLASADSTHALRSAHDKRGVWERMPYPPASHHVRSLILMDRAEACQSAPAWRGPPRRAAQRLETPLFTEEGDPVPCTTK